MPSTAADAVAAAAAGAAKAARLAAGGGQQANSQQAANTHQAVAAQALGTQQQWANQQGAAGQGSYAANARKGRIPALPNDLRNPHCASQDENGANICFAFNQSGGCATAPPGGQCPRGRHICVLSTCRAPHGYIPSKAH